MVRLAFFQSIANGCNVHLVKFIVQGNENRVGKETLLKVLTYQVPTNMDWDYAFSICRNLLPRYWL